MKTIKFSCVTEIHLTISMKITHKYCEIKLHNIYKTLTFSQNKLEENAMAKVYF